MGQKIYESDKFLKTGGTSSQYLMADGTTSTGPTGGVDVGTGTANKVAKFSDSDTITDGIMTDDGTSVLVGGNLAIGTGDNDNLFHIEATDTTYDVSRAMEIDYTKSHSTTGWGASAFGIRTNVYADGTGQNADIQGGSFTAKHIGSGVSYYLLGSQSNAKHEGSGNTGSMWGAFNQATVTGSGTGTHPFLIGTNQKAVIDNANASVGSMSGILAIVKTSAGDVTGRMDAAWLQIDGNQGATTVVDANVLYLQADTGNITASGTMRTIHSISTLPSLFLGTMETTSFIKTGGTSSQFLKADGSVDSSTYSTSDTQLTTEEVQDIVGAMVQSNTEQSISVTYSDGDGKLNFDAGAATYTHPGETAFTAAVDTGALTGAVVVSDIDMNITTNAFGHVEDAAMAVATRTLTLADLGFTGDVDATNDQTLPTDFVSAASGGSFGGGIVADSFTITGLSSGNSFLKANGSLDGTTYNSGAGASGGVAVYDGTNTTTDDTNLQYNFLNSTLTVRNVDVSVDLNVGGDVDITDNVTIGGSVQAEGWTYVPQTFISNFSHSSGSGWVNVPFNSLGDNPTGGEQHFIVAPYSGYVHAFAMKNTATGTAMTGANLKFRVLVNGVLRHTSGTQTFTAAARTYKGWALTSTDALFNAGDDIRIQFECTTGLWRDTVGVLVLKCII